eukprot:GDKI01037512.1.p1 GENE.GDKI01037512.1~~GDKI01037512.1.p1  ORF type:complete len:332 (+),score=84.28 GDKI01037512.1:96-1091(+)
MSRSFFGVVFGVFTLCFLSLAAGQSSEVQSVANVENDGNGKRLRTEVKFYKWTPETEKEIKTHRIKKMFCLFYDKTNHLSEQMLLDFESVASTFRKKDVLHVAVEREHLQPFAFFLDDDPELDLPFAVLVEIDNGFRKYRLINDLSIGKLTDFENRYWSNTLKPWLRSEPAFANPDGAAVTGGLLEGGGLVAGEVAPLAGVEWGDRVVKNDKDVLVFFYAPWCGHCKRFEPRFGDLAMKHKNVDTLLFHKIDVTKNDIDHPGVKIDRVPYVRLFPAGDKSTPKVFEHAQQDTVGWGTTFLEEAVTHKYDLVKLDRAAEAKQRARHEGVVEL